MVGLVAGRVALVTGGGRGIGRAICLALARHGADVVVADLDGASAAAVAEEVRGLGARAVSLTADVTRAADRQAMLDAAGQLGPLDILVNNAGIVQIADWFEMSEADWDRMLEVNAKSVFFMCQAALPAMLDRRAGTIVNIASIAGKVATAQFAVHYNASKAAVIAMTKTLAFIGAPHGVRVNSVCPGNVDTPMWERIDRELTGRQGQPLGAAWQAGIAGIPMGRGGEPDDVAKVVVFLASDLAGYMTGQAINVSGGLVTY